MRHVPRTVATITGRGFAACLTAQVVVAVGQLLFLWGHQRPHLTVMVFGLCMTGSIVLGTATVLARCHMSIAQAFAAGVYAGQQAPAAPPEEKTQGLRVVE